MKRRAFIKNLSLGSAFIAFTGFHSIKSFISKTEHPEPFTIIALPDTQLYSLYHPKIFAKQTRWIKENREKLNIACVVHEGDITHKNSEKEWKAADQAMSVLDGSIPYCMALGNHDLGPGGTAENRDASLFNKHFGPARFKNKPWYGGHFAEGNENACYLINEGGMKLLVVCLEFGARDVVLDWASNIMKKHKDRKAIVVTHCYTYSDSTRVGEGDKWNPHDYGCDGNDGEEIWDKFISRHENIFLVLSGHILNDGLGRLTSTGDHGNRVHQILANYQMKDNGGNGWLRIMKFSPAENKIRVTTYSPLLDQYATGPQNEFELDY